MDNGGLFSPRAELVGVPALAGIRRLDFLGVLHRHYLGDLHVCAGTGIVSASFVQGC